MGRRDARRQNKAVIIAVHHDHRADHPRAHAPTRRPAEFLFAFARLELNPARARKILSEKMRSAGLDRFAVLHHRFDRQASAPRRETFALRFLAGVNRNGEMIAHKGFVNVEHLLRFCARFGFGLVHGVAFLPEKLGRAQKQARPHFPAHDVGPLIDQDRQVAIGLHPFRVARADDRLGRRPNDERLSQRTRRFHFSIGVHFQPAVRDDRAFFGEAFDVLRFFREITQRNEKREIGVLMPGGLETSRRDGAACFPRSRNPTAG